MQTTQNIADHLTWRQEVDDLLAQARSVEDDAERDELHERAHLVRSFIAATPADSPAAIAAQIALVIEADDAGSVPGEVEMTALRTAHEALASRGDDGPLMALWAEYVATWHEADAADDEAEPIMARLMALEAQAARMPAHGAAGALVHLRLALFQRHPDEAMRLFVRREPSAAWLDPHVRLAIEGLA